MKKMTFTVFIVLFTQFLFANSAELLSEASLKKMIDKRPPTIEQVEGSFLQVQSEALSKKDKYGYTLEAQGQLDKSNERLLGKFDGGVTSRASNFTVGVKKVTRYGIDLGVEVFGSKASNSFISDAADTGVRLSLSLDLYQNFLGRNSKNDLLQSEIKLKRAELEKKIGVKSFESNIRKIYWGLVANNEQKRLLTVMLDLSKKQLAESRRRYKLGVSDAGEVAKYHSVMTTRESALLSINYAQTEYMKSLKELLPEMNGTNFALDKYDSKQIRKNVLACTDLIKSYDKAPLKLTPYTEIVDILNEEEKLEYKMLKSYDGLQLRLQAQYSSIGRDFGYEDARSNFLDHARPKTSIGVFATLPLGKKKKATKEVLEKVAKNRYQTQMRSYISRITSFHSETANTVSILRKVIHSQKETNKYLAISLDSSNKKFKQARISVQELINEQNSLLQSRYDEITTNLTILNTLMDYFSIYTDIPCKMNRI